LIEKALKEKIVLSRAEAKKIGEEAVLLPKDQSIIVFSLEEAEDIKRVLDRDMDQENRRKAFRLIFSQMRKVKVKEGKIKTPPSIIKKGLK